MGMLATSSRVRDESTRELGRTIATHLEEIERRWLETVQQDLVDTPEVAPTQLRDGMPGYLHALAELMCAGEIEHAASAGLEIWTRIAREHGVTRVRIGFDINQLIHEFIALRHTIIAVAGEHCAVTLENQATLADLIDAAIAESAQAYVHARNYEMRRVQAGNIGFITHELRNPLATAISAVDLLRLQLGEDQQRPLAALQRAHDRLTRLIDSVLDVEQLEACELKARPADVVEGELLERASAAASAAAKTKGIALHIRCQRDRVIRVDPELTGSAIQNLLDNAVKYTDHGHVDVEVEDTDTSWAVHVRDSCPGLSAEELATIFEPFRRGKTSKPGSGLGLAIARRAVEAQGGAIAAESPNPDGCHFWLTLPK